MAARATPTSSRVLEEECIFCDKASKYIKDQKTRENLIKCCELRADSKIRDSAIKKLDERLLEITSMELVAAKGHISCAFFFVHTTVESQLQAVDWLMLNKMLFVQNCRKTGSSGTSLVCQERASPYP